MPNQHCNYEHLGGCSDRLTHRAPYWLGEARKAFGQYAYWCGAHASQAWHINGLRALNKPVVRESRASVAK